MDPRGDLSFSKNPTRTVEKYGAKIIPHPDFDYIFNTILHTIGEKQIENWADDTSKMGIITVSSQK